MPPDVRVWPTKRATLAGAPVGGRALGASFPLSATKSVQNLGEHRQRDYRRDGDEPRSHSLGQPPKRVAGDGHRQARRVLSFVDGAGWTQDRCPNSCEKRVWIALRQQFARTFADFGADECELRMQLPRLDVPVRGRLRLVYRPSAGPSGRLSRNGAKAGLELERAFDGDGSQVLGVIGAGH